MKNPDSLEAQLRARHFGDYFFYPTYTETLDKIWAAQADDPKALQTLIADGHADGLARLIACETLFEVDQLMLEEVGMENVAAVYCNALSKDLTGMGNSWGLLWENEDAGPQGGNLLSCGEFATQPLLALLENAEVRTNFEGSEEATVGNAARFRVKDFAAYYLADIHSLELPWHTDFEARDKAIAAMVAELPEE